MHIDSGSQDQTVPIIQSFNPPHILPYDLEVVVGQIESYLQETVATHGHA
ncbi:MAG: hypothetical protein J6386_11580 [Candidatus Synoicihabitans palmerolidicus]|nr:hypothetical protein [Candidatus Synoicihabitans palmerolidicus]